MTEWSDKFLYVFIQYNSGLADNTSSRFGILCPKELLMYNTGHFLVI